ncbi:hypothetical protein Tco_1337582 [Tanacetum coccineum]
MLMSVDLHCDVTSTALSSNQYCHLHSNIRVQSTTACVSTSFGCVRRRPSAPTVRERCEEIVVVREGWSSIVYATGDLLDRRQQMMQSYGDVRADATSIL